MTKLTKENIQFINRYLSSEIVFTDIRIEMVDHVASAIEQKMTNGDQRTFYYIFKDYMVENKASLLKDNEKFMRITDKKIGLQLLKNILSFKCILFFTIVFISLYILQNLLEERVFNKLITNAPIVILLFEAIIYSIVRYNKKKERYSSIERLGIYFLFLYHLNYFMLLPLVKKSTFINQNTLVAIGISSFLIAISFIFVFITFQYKKEYKLRFKL